MKALTPETAFIFISMGVDSGKGAKTTLILSFLIRSVPNVFAGFTTIEVLLISWKALFEVTPTTV